MKGMNCKKMNNSATIKVKPLGIGVSCTICGNTKELNEIEAEYARHFGTVAGIYICDECKNAIEWAKSQLSKEKHNG